MRDSQTPLIHIRDIADRRRHADLRAIFGATKANAPVMISRTLAHFEILRKIGSGSGGAVYLARDNQSAKNVALKVPWLSADLESQSRFRREGDCGLLINHPNVVKFYQILHAHPVDVIVMEYARGKTLYRLIPPGGLPVGKCRHYALQMSTAVGALHARKLMHRDLKPENFLVDKRHVVKLVDFGLAKPLQEEGAGPCPSSDTALLETRVGTILGTAAYMAPEQVRGQGVDRRADVFSLGVLLYEMLTGRRPFLEATPADTMFAILYKKPRPLPARVPAKLAAIIGRCLKKNPAQRYTTANDLAAALAALSKSPPSTRRTSRG